MKSNIITIEQTRAHNPQCAALQEAVRVLGWEMRAQAIAKALELPLGEALAQRVTKIPKGTLAEALGHTSVESFISSDPSDMGLGIEWAQWEQQVRAAYYKEKFNLYADDPVEIINQYRDIKELLGREPVSAAQFHRVKDQHLIRQRHDLRAHFQGETEQLQGQIRAISGELDQVRDELRGERLVSAEISERYQQLIEKMDERVALIKAQSGDAIAAALGEQKAELEEHYAQLIEQMHRQAAAHRELAAAAPRGEAHAQGEMIPQSSHQAVLDQLQKEREYSKHLIERLGEADRKFAELEAAFDGKAANVAILNKIISEQTALLNVLRAKLDGARIEQGEFSLEQIEKMQQRIEKLESYLERFRAKTVLWKDRYHKSMVRVDAMQQSLDEARKALHRQRARQLRSGQIVRAIKSFGHWSVALSAGILLSCTAVAFAILR